MDPRLREDDVGGGVAGPPARRGSEQQHLRCASEGKTFPFLLPIPTIYYIMLMLGIEQRKGNDKRLCGRMIAYARILPSPDADRSSTPFDDMVKNGILALEGDFRQQPVLPNKRSLNRAMDERIDNLIETMREEGVDLPEDIDVDSLRERLHELSNMEVIPIPARICNFSSEADILKEDADIYFVGEFIGMNQAHFCLTTLPIYYQARYREQAKVEEMALLNEMLSQFETGEIMDNDDIQKETEELFPEGASLNTFVGDLNNLLNSRVVPFLLACETDADYEAQVQLFYKFMKSYPEQRDVKLIDGAIRELRKKGGDQSARKLLELGCKKINALYNEDIKGAEELNQQITDFSSSTF